MSSSEDEDASTSASIKERRKEQKDFDKRAFKRLKRDVGINDVKCKRVKTSLTDIGLWPNIQTKTPKIFNDPIHGEMKFHPACVAVVNTPEFQRLRFLKQFGFGYFVYPGAAHNRFEHCLGVSHLAGQYVRILKENQPELGINDKDILCVELAGLCHDLGHGPFSHVFDGRFVKMCPDIKKKIRNKWKHELVSKKMFKHIYRNNSAVAKTFREYGLANEDLEFIGELMTESRKPKLQKKYKRQRPEKAFLFEIVANDFTGIDVDKLDYLQRDCHQLGMRNNFDHYRYMKFSRVIKYRGKKRIAIRDKEIMNLHGLFSTRYKLHKFACQHNVVSALDIMASHAMIKANKHVKITQNGDTISDIINNQDWKGYTLLTDNILQKICDTTGESEDLKQAQQIIRRIFRRQYYKCVAESKPFTPDQLRHVDQEGETKEEKEEMVKEEILENIPNRNRPENIEDKVFVQLVTLDFGNTAEGPFKHICSFSKDKPDVGKKFSPAEASRILNPSIFREQLLRIYVSDIKVKPIIKRAWDEWKGEHFPDEDN